MKLLIGCYLILAISLVVFLLTGVWGWVCLGAFPGAALWFYSYLVAVAPFEEPEGL